MASESSVDKEIRALEEQLLDHNVRQSEAALNVLLADDFVEFGGSGRIFNRDSIIKSLHGELNFTGSIRNFEVRKLAPDVVLATYLLLAQSERGTEGHSSLRSSIWRQRLGKWQLLFHQGTPAK